MFESWLDIVCASMWASLCCCCWCILFLYYFGYTIPTERCFWKIVYIPAHKGPPKKNTIRKNRLWLFPKIYSRKRMYSKTDKSTYSFDSAKYIYVYVQHPLFQRLYIDYAEYMTQCNVQRPNKTNKHSMYSIQISLSLPVSLSLCLCIQLRVVLYRDYCYCR